MRNGSKISMKKYHQSPTLGARSDSVSWMPYVRSKNSHELPANKKDIPNRAPITTADTATQVKENVAMDSIRRLGFWRSYASRMREGRIRIGYIDR